MRNADKIKALEKELGRYRKKVADQSREIKELERRHENAVEANMEMHKAVDAILARLAVKYGRKVKDEETGEVIGFRVTVPVFSVDDTLRQYEVRTRKNAAAGKYTVGVMERRATAKNETQRSSLAGLYDGVIKQMATERPKKT